jgi:RNA polymerase sigma factor (sigma-70 family)
MRSFQSISFIESHISDPQLWVQLMSGEIAGLEGIYVRFSPGLFRYGMAIKSNRSFIKDCIQELFVDLWKYRNTLAHTDNVRLFLIRCLSNKINKEIGKEKRMIFETEISKLENIFLEESVEDRFIDVQRDQELQLKLKKGLEKLPLRQREAIQLLFFENQNYEETSKILGINVESCYTLAWKAIKSLRKNVFFLLFGYIGEF